MSHFAGFIFGTNVELRLERYSEEREVEPYIRRTREQLLADARQEIANGATLSDDPHWQPSSDDDLIKTYAEYEEITLDADNNHVSTRNQEARWDWWQYGGRFARLVNKTGDEVVQARLSDIDWIATADNGCWPTFCYLDLEGEWHERVRMGWWGVSYDMRDGDDWERELREYIRTLSPDTIVTVIDFHI